MTAASILCTHTAWHQPRARQESGALPTGYPQLDALLPGAGWPGASLSELFARSNLFGVLPVLVPALAQLSQCDKRWICCVAPPGRLSPSVLSHAGVDPSRLLQVHPKAHQDGLEVVEAALRSGRCSAVLAWPVLDDPERLQRLQAAAQAGDTRGFLVRPQRIAGRDRAPGVGLSVNVQSDGAISVSRLFEKRGVSPRSVSLPPEQSGFGAMSAA